MAGWGRCPREPVLGGLARPTPNGSDRTNWSRTPVVTPSGRYGTDDQPNVLSSNRRCQDFRPFQPLSCCHEIVDPVISPKQDGFLEDEGGHLPNFSIGTRAEPLPEGTRCCLSRPVRTPFHTPSF